MVVQPNSGAACICSQNYARKVLRCVYILNLQIGLLVGVFKTCLNLPPVVLQLTQSFIAIIVGRAGVRTCDSTIFPLPR